MTHLFSPLDLTVNNALKRFERHEISEYVTNCVVTEMYNRDGALDAYFLSRSQVDEIQEYMDCRYVSAQEPVAYQRVSTKQQTLALTDSISYDGFSSIIKFAS